MQPHRYWVFSPDAGGTKIPDAVKLDVKKRIESVAAQRFKGKYARLDIRFKGQFCYIDAYQDTKVGNDRPVKNRTAAREEQLRNTPIHLCRLRYFCDDRWSFAFYTYSNEKYELSVYPKGSFFGKPEDAFLASAVYLR